MSSQFECTECAWVHRVCASDFGSFFNFHPPGSTPGWPKPAQGIPFGPFLTCRVFFADLNSNARVVVRSARRVRAVRPVSVVVFD